MESCKKRVKQNCCLNTILLCAALFTVNKSYNFKTKTCPYKCTRKPIMVTERSFNKMLLH